MNIRQVLQKERKKCLSIVAHIKHDLAFFPFTRWFGRCRCRDSDIIYVFYDPAPPCLSMFVCVFYSLSFLFFSTRIWVLYIVFLCSSFTFLIIAAFRWNLPYALHFHFGFTLSSDLFLASKLSPSTSSSVSTQLTDSLISHLRDSSEISFFFSSPSHHQPCFSSGEEKRTADRRSGADDGGCDW